LGCDWDEEGAKGSGQSTHGASAQNGLGRREFVALEANNAPIANGATGGATSGSFVGWRNTSAKNVSTAGLGLFGAVRDPEEVIEFLGVARVGVVGAFVFVFNVGAGGLHSFSGFSGSVGGAVVDGAVGGFGKIRGGEGQWHGKSCCSGSNQKHAEYVLLHSVLNRNENMAASTKQCCRPRDHSSEAAKQIEILNGMVRSVVAWGGTSPVADYLI
jgi:hypothetical protein